MKIIIEPGKSKNVIATVAIGNKYYEPWEKYALPSWKKYCKRYDLGLIVFETDLIPTTDKFWKKATWQTMLIADTLKKNLPSISNVCYLDTDILISINAPNVFDFYDPSTIGLVSLRKNLPYPYDIILRQVAFLRNKYYDSKYPLDSALFISVEDLYKFHNLPVQEDECCCGFYVFNIENHAKILKSSFEKYDSSVQSITAGGNQTHFNYEVQSNCKISWLDYRFQAIWLFEMVWKYPFLYNFGRDNKELIKECIEASLFTNYFLHFAGIWHESEMWNMEGILDNIEVEKRFEDFNTYLKVPVTGKPIGQVKPE